MYARNGWRVSESKALKKLKDVLENLSIGDSNHTRKAEKSL
jgi:hypothetical protein